MQYAVFISPLGVISTSHHSTWQVHFNISITHRLPPWEKGPFQPFLVNSYLNNRTVIWCHYKCKRYLWVFKRLTVRILFLTCKKRFSWHENIKEHFSHWNNSARLWSTMEYFFHCIKTCTLIYFLNLHHVTHRKKSFTTLTLLPCYNTFISQLCTSKVGFRNIDNVSNILWLSFNSSISQYATLICLKRKKKFDKVAQ